MKKAEHIFIVGSSRSGTTMLGRILNQHQDIKTIKELHFFGMMYDGQKKTVSSKEELILLLARLLLVEKNGIFTNEDKLKFRPLALEILSNRNSSCQADIFKEFLKHIKLKNNVKFVCEQTPRNVFYLKEIFKTFPNSVVINMVRDPRDVMLSQKHKWKRRYLGAKKIPLSESVRAYINYNPFLIARFWKSSLKHAQNYKGDIFTVQFENLLKKPKEVVNKLCSIIGVKYNENMLHIPNKGSSNNIDFENNNGIDDTKIGKWQKGGLNSSEIFICQLICGKEMKDFNYSSKKFSFPPLFFIIYFIFLPIQLILILVVNLHRMKNLFRIIRKRLA